MFFLHIHFFVWRVIMRNFILGDDVFVTNACILTVFFGIVIFTIFSIMRERKITDDKSTAIIDVIVGVSFGIYILIVLYATLGCRNEYAANRLSLKPFAIYKSLMSRNEKTSVKAFHDIVQNILFFIPFGFYLQYYGYKKVKWYQALLMTMSVSIVIETTQYITRLGYTQIDDIIHNTLSGCIGFFLAGEILNLIKNKKE